MAKLALNSNKEWAVSWQTQWVLGVFVLALVLVGVGLHTSGHGVLLTVGHVAAGQQPGSAAAAATPAAACDNSFFDPTHEALAGLCKTYSQVCFDQGHVVSYDPAYSPANTSSEPLPKLEIEVIEYSWAGADDNGDKFRNAQNKYAPLSMRAAGVLEEGDLLRPTFSNCTAVVMWTQWVHNFGESLSHVTARMWQLWADGRMGNGTLLALGTPAGERTRSFWPFFLQPYTVNAVMSFAELSARTAAGAEPSHPYGRCFRTAHLCAFSDAGYFQGMYGAMQAAYHFYERRLPKPEPAATFDAGDDTLKVLIEHRNGTIRRLLNWEELVAECNSVRWELPGTSPWKKVQCRSTTLGADPMHNLAAVRPADMVVIVHGSGCSNWLAMREGSALLEIRPYKFGSEQRGWSDWFYPNIAAAIEYKVHWYAINIEDEALSTPSEREAEHVNEDHARYLRDRHTTLPFAALRTMVARVAGVGRSKAEYDKVTQPVRKHYVELAPGGKLQPIPV